MKKITIVPFILMAGFFVSCTSNESEENLTNSTEISLDLKSSLSEKNYEGGCKKMSNIMNTMNTRSCTVTEDMGKEALAPFIDDGKVVQEQITNQAFLDNVSAEDKEYLNNLSESDLAALSFLVYNLNEADKEQANGISTSKLRSCLAFAIGLTAIKELSIKGVITAVSLRQALFAIGKRYLGYIGVCLMIADFYDCCYNRDYFNVQPYQN